MYMCVCEAVLNICKKLNNHQSNIESSHPWLPAVFTEKHPGVMCPLMNLDLGLGSLGTWRAEVHAK